MLGLLVSWRSQKRYWSKGENLPFCPLLILATMHRYQMVEGIVIVGLERMTLR